MQKKKKYESMVIIVLPDMFTLFFQDRLPCPSKHRSTELRASSISNTPGSRINSPIKKTQTPLPGQSIQTPQRPHQQATVEMSDEDDNEESDDEDGGAQSHEEGEGEAEDDEKNTRWKPPTVVAAKITHDKIKCIFQPPRNTGKGYKDPSLDLLIQGWLEAMMWFLWAYTNPASKVYNHWSVASLETACAMEHGPWFA